MLSSKQLEDIKKLQQECETYDQLQLKLNWEMLKNRETDQLDFLQYDKEELVAFLGLYPFGSTVEVCGMVKPTERRKNHFSHLFQKAMDTSKHLGFHKILLNAPAGSVEGKAFLEENGAIYAFSENQMKWEAKYLEEVNDISLRHATTKDINMRVRLSVEGFGLSEKDALEMELRINSDVDSDMYMIVVNEDTVGKIRVNRQNGEAWIYGFSILPIHQGKGIGRKVLTKVVKEQSESGHTVHLEVETKNAHALGLYESIGFKIVHAQDYYTYN